MRLSASTPSAASTAGAAAAAGVLTAAGLCQTIAALQPADTILVDESLTSGGSYWDASKVNEYAVHHI